MKVTTSQPVAPDIHITLTMKEAQDLAGILGRISNPDSTPDRIESVLWAELIDLVRPWGGQAQVRLIESRTYGEGWVTVDREIERSE